MIRSLLFLMIACRLLPAHMKRLAVFFFWTWFPFSSLPLLLCTCMKTCRFARRSDRLFRMNHMSSLQARPMRCRISIRYAYGCVFECARVERLWAIIIMNMCVSIMFALGCVGVGMGMAWWQADLELYMCTHVRHTVGRRHVPPLILFMSLLQAFFALMQWKYREAWFCKAQRYVGAFYWFWHNRDSSPLPQCFAIGGWNLTLERKGTFTQKIYFWVFLTIWGHACGLQIFNPRMYVVGHARGHSDSSCGSRDVLSTSEEDIQARWIHDTRRHVYVPYNYVICVLFSEHWTIRSFW